MKEIRNYFKRGEKVQQLIAEQRKQRSPGRSLGAPGLNCLVLGGGGREYAIAWRLARCDSVATIDVVPGNGPVEGARVTIICYTTGESVRSNSYWAKIAFGPDRYVPATYLRHGHAGAPAGVAFC